MKSQRVGLLAWRIVTAVIVAAGLAFIVSQFAGLIEWSDVASPPGGAESVVLFASFLILGVPIAVLAVAFGLSFVSVRKGLVVGLVSPSLVLLGTSMSAGLRTDPYALLLVVPTVCYWVLAVWLLTLHSRDEPSAQPVSDGTVRAAAEPLGAAPAVFPDEPPYRR